MRRAIKKSMQAVSPPQAAPVAASAGAAASAPTSTTSVAACSAVAAVSGTASAPASGGASERATNATVDEVATKVKKAVNKTIDDVKMTPFLRKITFFSSGGSFLDGYVLAIIGVALTQITPLFALDTMWSAAVGASVFLGIFFPKVGLVGDSLAIIMTLGTLSFLVTTPEVWVPNLGSGEFGFPLLSGAGRLVIKDIVILAGAVVLLSDSSQRVLKTLKKD